LIQTTIAALCILAVSASVCSAQIIESVGIRAVGMAGAFVAVASDSTATWWNPAGLAAGPFVDVNTGRTTTDIDDRIPARKDRVAWIAASAPPIGFSYYRFKVTDIRRFDPTAQPLVNRQDTRAEVSLQSLSVSDLGLTLVQSILPGIHVGATLKYVRGTVHSAIEDAARGASALLEEGEDLEGGDTSNHFDLDAGVLAVAGPVRLGAVVRNVREPQFGSFTLTRQPRLGAALDLEAAGGPPLIVALDADARTYNTATGDRRVIAIGAEEWFLARRLGVRGGARFNTVGAREKGGAAGASVAVSSGTFVEGEVTRGGSDAERGWGLGVRVSF